MKKKILSILITILALCTCMFTLTACGESPHTHVYNQQVVTDVFKATNATCTSKATYYYSCTCGEKGADTFEHGEALGHSFTNYVYNNDATCELDGTETAFCSNACGESDTRTKTGSALEHDYSAWVTNNNGTHTRTCSHNNSHKETKNCNGGAATCRAKAVCIDCGAEYGSLAGHIAKEEWSTTEKEHYHACKTENCTEKLDKEKHTFDKNKQCTTCGYITTALLGTEIASDVYEVDGTNLFVKVPNSQNHFNFAETIEVADGATYKVYTDIGCREIDCIPSYAVNDLAVENNTYYILVTNDGYFPKTYTVTVRRRPMYEVVFNTDGGTSVQNQIVEEDSFATEPNTTKTGYTFAGWDYDFSNPIISKKTINASWNINQYSITFVLNNGEENIVIRQNYNTSITAPVPAKTGCTFMSWDKTIPIVMPAENLIITANWQINQYTLTIVYGNGQADKKITQDYNSNITETLPSNLERNGYTFNGWDKEIPEKMPAKDLTISAKWQINQYTLTIVYGNGQDNLVLTQDYDTSIQSVFNPLKTGYTFNGWDKEIPAKMPAKDLTISAMWQINQYTLTIVYGNGQDNLVLTQDYDSNITETLPSNLERNGYTFNGWDKEIPEKMPTHDIIINAKWLAIFNVSDGVIAGLTTHGDTLAEVNVPETIDGVKTTIIGYGAFEDCTSLTSIVIPGSVTSIGSYAFRDCTSLTSIEIPDSVTSIGSYAFYGCRSLTSIVIPDSVTSIGDGAFDGCYKLVEVINESTTITIEKGSSSNGYVGYYALEVYNSGDTFAGTKLSIDNSYIIYTNGNEKILVDYNGKETKLILPNYVTKINNDVFYNCDSLTSVVICDGVTSIGASAFYGCRSLTSIVIPDSVTSIGDGAFYGCRSLTSIVIPDSVTSIGDGAFDGCSSLTSVIIGDSVTSIGNYAFIDCTSLTSIEIPDSVTSIGGGAFLYCSSLTSVVIPDSVTSIGDGAFEYCSSLTSVIIGDSVTSIGSYAFYNCTSLTSIVIPDSVTSIGDAAFSGCSNLEYNVDGNLKYLGNSKNKYLYLAGTTSIDINSATINANCKVIGIGAFYKCSSLQSITLPFVGATLNGTSNTHFGYIFGASSYFNNKDYVPSSLKTVIITGEESIGSYAFYNCTSLTSIVIPDSVTSIASSALNGCSSLESITLPFVGAKAGVTSSDSYQYPFGYIFGTSSYTGSYSAYQYYYGLSTSSTTGTTYYIPTSLKSVTITSVTSIGKSAFYNCTSLTSIVIPDSVTSIGSSAFESCSSLTSVVIGDSVTSIGSDAFYGCSSLTSVNYLGTIDQWVQIEFSGYYSNPLYYVKNLYINGELVAEVNITTATKVSNYAFYNCSSLTSIEIPDSVTSIGSYAFYNCSSLTSVIIGDSVTSIGARAFIDCTSLTSIEIPDSVTSIGDGAFYNCSSLTSVEIPDSVTSIGSYAFRDCTSLTSVVIGDSVTSIGDGAFYNCSSLTSVEIPDSVTSIGASAFSGCSNLEYNVDGNLKYLGNSKNKYLYLAGTTSIDINSATINANCKVIGIGAFYNCSSLTSIEIPDSVTSIGRYAFENCSSLTSVVIGNSVTSIGSYAFYNCSSLTSVVIGDSVTSIGGGAFYNCSSLKTVYYSGAAEDWDKISIGSSNTYLTNATRYYYVENESDLPADNGNYWHYVDGVPTPWTKTED